MLESIRRFGVILVAATATFVAGSAGAQCGIGDVNDDGTVDSADLALVLGAWGSSVAVADLNSDDVVDAADLSLLLGNWGPIAVSVGSFPDEWISGGPNCVNEPQIQVHQYDENTYILRQSLCTNFEAPFVYLLFGDTKVLMEDTGASNVPFYNTVKSIIDAWLVAHRQSSIQLIVSHSHAHGDHAFNDSQFVGKPNTTVVGTSLTAVKNFFGIVNWPTQIVNYDLGGRVVQIIPIPGHHTAHIAIYDARTGWLLTGDTLYPGRLYISSWASYKASIQRMVDFTADKQVCWVMGTHIEMTKTPGVDYAMGVTSHPNEHGLQLTREHLIELNDACIAMGAAPVYQVHDDFIIFPLSLAMGGRLQDAPSDAANAEVCCMRPTNVFEYRRARVGDAR
ncbi:MAG: MBL fold metallo-hydrolase [Phycisphaerae bacterium]|nr:MBL fold metallo-hydrolase [Phycisphaerae bacterium]